MKLNMKKLVLVWALAVAGAGIMAGATVALAGRYLSRPPVSSAAALPADCPSAGPTHQVVITNGRAQPAHVDAALCDSLVITNADNRYRLLAFGPHDHHQAYDGVSERMLGRNQSLSISLVQRGAFIFHDHLDEAAAGSFTVR